MLKLINQEDGTIISSRRDENGEVFITITNVQGISLLFDFQAAMQLDILLGTIIMAEEDVIRTLPEALRKE